MNTRTVLFLVLALLPAALPGQSYTGARSTAIGLSYTQEAGAQYDSAIATILSAGPAGEDYFLNLRLGWLYYLKQDYPTATRYYRSAEKSEPRSIEAKVGLMYCFQETHDGSGAFETARSLFTIDPANQTAHRFMIDADIAIHEYSRAETRTLEALQYYPIDLIFNVRLARIYLLQERKAEARAVAEMLQTIYGKKNVEVASLLSSLQ